jgi:hypothetical protein
MKGVTAWGEEIPKICGASPTRIDFRLCDVSLNRTVPSLLLSVADSQPWCVVSTLQLSRVHDLR